MSPSSTSWSWYWACGCGGRGGWGWGGVSAMLQWKVCMLISSFCYLQAYRSFSLSSHPAPAGNPRPLENFHEWLTALAAWRNPGRLKLTIEGWFQLQSGFKKKQKTDEKQHVLNVNCQAVVVLRQWIPRRAVWLAPTRLPLSRRLIYYLAAGLRAQRARSTGGTELRWERDWRSSGPAELLARSPTWPRSHATMWGFPWTEVRA